jgi:hypothetical protein
MENWQSYLTFGVVQVLMLVGLFGSLVPFFPGTFIMWLATLGYGFVTGWDALGIVFMILISLLFAFSMVVDNLLMGAGAIKGGASWLSIFIGLVFGIAGTIFFPPFGGLIAAPVAVFSVEWIRAREIKKAWKAFVGMVVGYGLAYLARFGIGVLMMLLWWLWVWQGA